MIQSIESIYQDKGVVYINAIVEDIVQTAGPTLYDPAEYGPALCEASFELDEDEVLPDNDYDLIQMLENLDLEWIVIDNSDYY